MKIRNGFVSNSSSSSFILDKRKLSPDVLHRIRSLADMDLLDRCTGSIEDPQTFVDDRKKDFGDWYENGFDTFNEWIQKWINILGNENLVIVRESDEGMGGELEDVGLSLEMIERLAEDEMEYH